MEVRSGRFLAEGSRSNVCGGGGSRRFVAEWSGRHVLMELGSGRFLAERSRKAAAEGADIGEVCWRCLAVTRFGLLNKPGRSYRI